MLESTSASFPRAEITIIGSIPPSIQSFCRIGLTWGTTRSHISTSKPTKERVFILSTLSTRRASFSDFSAVRLLRLINYYCSGYFIAVDSESEFKFMRSNSSRGSVCEESVMYQCPALLSSFCRREVIFQRDAIMKNLKLHFARSRKSR